MPLKYLLPALQMLAMLLLWVQLSPQAIGAPVADGGTPRTATIIPNPIAIDWAEGINLPASAVVTPVEFALRKPDALPNMKVRFYGFWLVGLLCWYMVGRFIDDLIRWRRARKLPRKNASDLAFALIAAPSAALLGIAFNEGNIQSRVLAAWGITWIAIASVALLFRVIQVVQQRKRRPIS